jgi:hypothetical protein
MGGKMKTLFCLIFLLPNITHAQGWYCDQVASAWVEEGKILSTCGYGTGSDENMAKTVAFENAKVEFKKVCGKETSCANRVVNIDPQRSDCKKTEDGVECKRLFYFHITSEYREVKEPEAPKPAPVIKNYNTTNVNNISHQHEHFNTYNVTQQPLKVINQIIPVDKDKDPRAKISPFRNYIRTVGNISIYETNSMSYQGIYLKNPSESEIDQAIKRASRGGMNRIYILRN